MSIYNKLEKIKVPTLIQVSTAHCATPRYRILYPDGRCEYAQFLSVFRRSCFQYIDLTTTIQSMEDYDSHHNYTITKIMEIK